MGKYNPMSNNISLILYQSKTYIFTALLDQSSQLFMDSSFPSKKKCPLPDYACLSFLLTMHRESTCQQPKVTQQSGHND